MKKLDSKWYYISAGMNAECLVIGVLAHVGVMLVLGFIGLVWSYEVAERRAAEEKNNG